MSNQLPESASIPVGLVVEDVKRISELITAMKNYSYLDQASLQSIDVHEGIENTLILLKHKLKYGMVVEREYGELPRFCAYGPQLQGKRI